VASLLVLARVSWRRPRPWPWPWPERVPVTQENGKIALPRD